MKRKVWTPEEDKQLLDLLSQGKTQEYAAFRMNRTVQSIYNRVNRLRKRHSFLDSSTVLRSIPEWSNIEKSRLMNLYVWEEKVPMEIASILGRSEEAIINKLKEMDLYEKQRYQRQRRLNK